VLFCKQQRCCRHKMHLFCVHKRRCFIKEFFSFAYLLHLGQILQVFVRHLRQVLGTLKEICKTNFSSSFLFFFFFFLSLSTEGQRSSGSQLRCSVKERTESRALPKTAERRFCQVFFFSSSSSWLPTDRALVSSSNRDASSNAFIEHLKQRNKKTKKTFLFVVFVGVLFV
jgi:hypothetical protein